MQDPLEDTEWNDILRQKGILPALPKEEKIWEEDAKSEEIDLDALDDDDEVMENIRKKRIAELELLRKTNKFGSVLEITGQDWVTEVNKAGDDIWVILHLYTDGVHLCNLINHHFAKLAVQFPATKFIKAVATTCIPNYPNEHLPTIFVYHNGDQKAKIIGPTNFSNNLNKDQLEWCFMGLGAVKSNMLEDPMPKTRDEISSSIRSSNDKKYNFYGE